MKRADLQQIVRWRDSLHEVIGIGEGRTITLAPIAKPPCPHCGSDHRVHILEHSPLFQDGVKPVKTVEERNSPCP